MTYAGRGQYGNGVPEAAETQPSGDVGCGKLSLLLTVPFLLVLIALVVFFVVREERLGKDAQLSELTETAAAFYEQIAVTRSWNALHGGVYAEITPNTQPNPYLTTPDRDMTSTDGRHFTKINPAYMTRQLSQIAGERHGYRFRLVGLKPVNPLNAPDEWEGSALRSMAKGEATAASAVRRENGRDIFQYLVPLRIEPACLVCHGKQGYRAGDVKGGIVIRIPMEKYHLIRSERMKKTILSLSAVGAVGILCTVLISLYHSRRLDREVRKNIAREKKITAMELGGAAAHELRQPLTIVLCMEQIMRDKRDRGETITGKELSVLQSQCLRMNEIIERLLHIMDCKTKKYDAKTDILDLEASSAGGIGGRNRAR